MYTSCSTSGDSWGTRAHHLLVRQELKHVYDHDNTCIYDHDNTCTCVRARLHQVSASTLRQLCYEVSNTVLIENNGVTQKWVATQFWGDSIVFNENSITSVITELLLH